MSMPAASSRQRLEVQIPSRGDGTLLECRIEHADGCNKNFGAVFAHPYGPLGGSFDDRVVGIVKEELLKAGAVVATFNFRGTGRSKGKASWSGEPEVVDFESVVLLLYAYMRELCPAGFAGGGPRIVLGGYSFGSLIASRVRPAGIASAGGGDGGSSSTNTAGILRTARMLAESGSEDAGNSADSLQREKHGQDDALDVEGTTYSYLLVSPLPGLVSRLLTPTSRFGLFRAQWDDEQVSCQPSLAVFGDGDCFSSAKKLRAWAQELRGKPNSLFRSAEVKDAGHFWAERSNVDDLREVLRTRLARLRDQKPRAASSS